MSLSSPTQTLQPGYSSSFLRSPYHFQTQAFSSFRLAGCHDDITSAALTVRARVFEARVKRDGSFEELAYRCRPF